MGQQKILILSRADDEHVERLVAELEMIGHPWIRFDPGSFPKEVELCSRLGQGADTGRITLLNGEQIVFDEIESIWYRRPTVSKM